MPPALSFGGGSNPGLKSWAIERVSPSGPIVSMVMTPTRPLLGMRALLIARQTALVRAAIMVRLNSATRDNRAYSAREKNARGERFQGFALRWYKRRLWRRGRAGIGGVHFSRP